jgi:hypothetical protein
VLLIKHRERVERSRFEKGTVRESSVVAEIDVTLQAVDGLSVWRDTLTYRAPLSARSPDDSVLFGPGATTFWLQFFVPVATWGTNVATRDARDLSEPAHAVDVLDGRAIVLLGDGSFKLFDMADPNHPAVVADYRRPRDLSRFDGVALLGDRAAVYGPDGLELVRLGESGPMREQVFGRDQVGSLAAVVAMGEGLALAGARGLLWIGAEQQAPREVVSRPIVGLARARTHLLFTDGSMLYSATPAQLSQGRVASELHLGREFDAQQLRVQGSRGVVIGARSLLTFDVSDPARLLPLSRVEMSQVGRVSDAVFYSGRTFLLGDRGLQILDESGQRIVESVDVSARQHLGAGGRQLVLIGDRTLQVVDATPFVTSTPAAAPERSE